MFTRKSNSDPKSMLQSTSESDAGTMPISAPTSPAAASSPMAFGGLSGAMSSEGSKQSSSTSKMSGKAADYSEPDGSKLVVGPDIHLKAEITSCDVLVIEGRMEATMSSDYFRVADCGQYTGDCETDVAVICGEFTGKLICRDRLLVESTARISGSIQYRQIEIKAGGIVSGTLEALPDPGVTESDTDKSSDTGIAAVASAAKSGFMPAAKVSNG